MTQSLEPRAGWWRRNPLRIRLVVDRSELIDQLRQHESQPTGGRFGQDSLPPARPRR